MRVGAEPSPTGTPGGRHDRRMHRQGRHHYRVSMARMEGVMMGVVMTFEESIAKIDNIVQSYVSEIAMLRASNADLLAAAKRVINSRVLDYADDAMRDLKTAIARAESAT